MAKNRGKEFESHLENDWESSVDGSWLFRLKDQMSKFKEVSKNPCDYIAFKDPNLFLLEVKSFKGNTFSVEFRQFPLLEKEYNKHIKGVFIGVILWFRDHDKIVYVPIETFIKLKKDGKKSFHVKYLQTKEYDFYEVPSEKLRVFMRSDFSGLIDYCRGRDERN